VQGFQGAEDLFEELNGVFGGRNARSKGAGRDVNISVPVRGGMGRWVCRRRG
jgi:hypothetical protein